MTLPELVDYDLPVAGGFHNCVIASIDKRFPKHAQKVMNAIWGAGLMSLAKLIIIVDADCDVHDYTEVAWRAFGNVDYAHDLLATTGPVDHLDHGSYQQFWGGKIGIDATRKWPEEGYTRGLAARGDHGAGGDGDRRPALEGVRAVTTAVPPASPSFGAPRRTRQGVPAAGDDRALGLRAAVRLPGRAYAGFSVSGTVHWRASSW